MRIEENPETKVGENSERKNGVKMVTEDQKRPNYIEPLLRRLEALFSPFLLYPHLGRGEEEKQGKTTAKLCVGES